VVTEFPLLEYDEEEKRYVAKHHPFTSPMDEDVELLDTDPLKVRAKAYDIVLNVRKSEEEASEFTVRSFSRNVQTSWL